MPSDPTCPLCHADGGRLVVRAARWRIVLVDDADHPAFTRVIWNAHVAEMSDLDAAGRNELLDAVVRVESVQRAALAPDKINLASLGNQVPHLHWHVIPRWHDDRHFPNSVWAVPRDDAQGQAALRSAAVRDGLDAYVAALHRAFADGISSAADKR
ncbi:MAG: HIT family protein [Burkholderiaceae bacterium]|jgi:diadenosine tetraphosphate (Ap4A) HIT family hydrolase|nr:HIT family protein [Burkholderiaceae bacterium]